jgi:chromosome segregation ATPase
VFCLISQEGGGHLKEAEKELSDAEKANAQLLAKDKAAADDLKAEVRRRQQVAKSMATDQNLLKKKQETLEKGREEYTTLEEQTQRLQTALEAARKRHQAASQGLFVDEQGNASSLQQQLIGNLLFKQSLNSFSATTCSKI